MTREGRQPGDGVEARAESRLRRLLGRFGLDDADLAAWYADGLPVAAFEDWLTDRVARRPSGERARQVYAAEDVHAFARQAILDALGLKAAERLLEIGCGGGLLLRDAASSGVVVAGVDHSEDMVMLARHRVPPAEVVLGDAGSLPFDDGAFDAVAMSIVFMFLADPVGVLWESRRVLAPGGRLALYTPSPRLRGTPAAPEPVASRCSFYDDDELAELARGAQLSDVRVVDHDGAQLLTAQR